MLSIVGPHDLGRWRSGDFGFQLDLLADPGHHVRRRDTEAGVLGRLQSYWWVVEPDRAEKKKQKERRGLEVH